MSRKILKIRHGALLVFLIYIATVFGCSGSGGGGGSTGGDTGIDTAPAAAFTVSSDIGSYPLIVVFDASGSTDSDGTIDQYSWQFGDGSSGSGVNITHTYTTEGTYTAQLTVTDDSGLTGTDSHDIQVKPLYTISGTVTSAEHVVTDSDVNDSNSTPVSNNSFAEAQEIVSPCSISGYVNIRRTGSRGRSWADGDPDDYYLVSLTKGMDITLYMAEDPANADLSLYLYGDAGNQIDASLTVGESVDSLKAPQDGIYYLRVEATRFASLYVLIIGRTNSATAQYPLRLSDDFIPGEVLVRFEDNSKSSPPTLANEKTRLSAMGLYTKARISERDSLLRRSDMFDKEAFFERLGVRSALARSLAPGYRDSETTAKMETLWMIRALRNQSGVQFAEPNYIRKPFTVPNDLYYPYQWHYPLIRLPEAWDITIGSNDVVVAVVDTGVLLDHPDLEGQLVDGYDFISDPDISLDGDGVDDDPDDPGDDDLGGSSFHGTHVAGTIAALTNNADNDGGGGVAGIAWNAKIMPLRALGKGGGTTSDILEAVRYAGGLETDAGVMLDQPVDIINLSFGGESFSQIEEAVYKELYEEGVIMIAAAGNSGSTDVMYPAGYESVVSVSAVTIDEVLTSYSNYGATIAVAAPGGDSTDKNGDGYPDGVLSTCGDDSSGSIEMGYAFYTGTSMAAPHVSGVVALMKALYPGLTPDRFESLLVGGYLTQDLGDSGRDDYFGYGLIDAYKAVLIAKEGGVDGDIPAVLVSSPSVLNFGSLLTSIDVTVKNGGDTPLTLTAFYTDASWLSVVASGDVDPDTGLGTYTVEVNREYLSDGTYTATVTFESSSNTVQVSVVMQVASVAQTANGGYHYILLIDPDTLETFDLTGSEGGNGLYEFEFSGLSYGDTYLLYAGTNPNNNIYICEDGEACGAYRSLDKPIELEIVQDESGIDFTTNIIVNLPYRSNSRIGVAEPPLGIKLPNKVAK
jgi:serine protease